MLCKTRHNHSPAFCLIPKLTNLHTSYNHLRSLSLCSSSKISQVVPLYQSLIMARRKSGKKPPPKKRLPKLETTFTCPFCNYPESIECKFDKELKIGEASCRICDESFCTKINFLTEAIDIYSEWIDACEAVNTSSNPRIVDASRPTGRCVIDFIDD